jgi:WD40 repeat protein
MGNMKVYHFLACLCITSSLVAACTPQGNNSTATLEAQRTPTNKAKIATTSPTITATITPTTTPEITEIPALSLKNISLDNVESLSQIKLLGDGRVSDVTFSPGGGLIAVGSSIGIRLHGAQDLIERAFLPSTQAITRVAFSPDGKLFSAGTQGGRILVYAVESLLTEMSTPPAPLKEIKANNFAITCLVFSPDSLSLTSGSLDRTILVWDPLTGKRIRSLGGFLLGISAIAYSPESDLLAGSSVDGSTRIWRIRTAEMLNSSGDADKRRNRVDHYPISLGFLKNGTLLTSWADGGITSWNWQSEEEDPVVITVQENSRVASSIINTKLDTLINIFSSGKVEQFFDISADKETSAPDELFESSDSALSAALSPDGNRLVIANYSSEISIWDLASLTLLKTYSRPAIGQQIITSAFSPDGNFLATSHGDGLVRIWDAENMHNYVEMTVSPIETTGAMTFSSDGRELLCGAEAIYIYPTEGFSELLALQLSKGSYPDHVNFTPSRKLFTGGTIKTLALSPDLKYLVTANLFEKTLRVSNPSDGKLIINIGGFDDPVEIIAFSPNSHTLAAGSVDHTVHLWSTERLDLNTPAIDTKPDLIIKNEFPVLSMLFSPDGQQLAMAGTNWNIRVVNSSNGALLFRLKGAKNQIICLAISSDGKLFATGVADGIIHIYGSEQGKQLVVLEGHAGMVNTLNFSPDGRMLISGGEDGTIRVWGLLN